MKTLRWIGSTKVSHLDIFVAPKLKPIRITAGALGSGTPTKDLYVSQQNRVLLRSKIAKRMVGEAEILVPAIKLLHLDGIEIVEDAKQVEYFHMLFDQHEIVFSNGAATESLFTGHEALRSVSAKARAEILQLFPNIEKHAQVSARLMPKGGPLLRQLVHRHIKNNKSIFGDAVGREVSEHAPLTRSVQNWDLTGPSSSGSAVPVQIVDIYILRCLAEIAKNGIGPSHYRGR